METNDVKKDKVGFFERLKIAIFNLENYGMFLGESLTVAFKYFFLLMFVITLIISGVETYNFSRQVNKSYSYIENELPDFKYSDGIVEFENVIEAYDSDYDFRLFINTDENIDKEVINNYKNKIYDSGYGIIALRDKLICITADQEVEQDYIGLAREYDFNITNKADLVSRINSVSRNGIITIYFIASVIMLYIVNTITILSDIFLVAVFGWFASRICGVPFKVNPIFILSIYSLSLSVVLKTIYYCVLSLTGFVVQYFNIIYLLIAYVYMVAAILMIKYDLIKQKEEIQKIIEDQQRIEDELKAKKQKEEQEENKDDKENEDVENKNEKKDNDEKKSDTENNDDDELDGSEI